MKTTLSTRWLVTALSVAGGVAYLYWGFLPGMRTMAEIRRQSAERRDYVEKADRLKPAVEDAARELSEAQAFNAKCQAALTDDRRLAELYGQINAQAKAAGATPKRFEPLRSNSELETLRQAPLALDALGNYQQLTRMLALLERLPATVWFDSVRITPHREDGQKDLCELKMAIFSARSDKND